MSTASTPLLAGDVHQKHHLAPAPIRFPSRGGSKVDGGPGLRHSADVEAQHPPASTMPPVNREGLPKLSRECLVSEVQCYGKYILSALLVFGLGGVLFALWITS
jgi:hypothetical protein